jgi:crossover junction endodeoxyribonuclease RuvC
MHTLLCIDPGKQGGMAIAINGKYVGCTAMPDTEGDVLRFINDVAQGHFVESAPSSDGLDCIIEQVHAMPGQGVTSMFTFGRGYGFLLGVLMTLGFRIQTVTPQRWQKCLGVGKSASKTEHKNKLKAKAQQLFPKAKVTLKTADALLMLHYAQSLPSASAAK